MRLNLNFQFLLTDLLRASADGANILLCDQNKLEFGSINITFEDNVSPVTVSKDENATPNPECAIPSIHGRSILCQELLEDGVTQTQHHVQGRSSPNSSDSAYSSPADIENPLGFAYCTNIEFAPAANYPYRPRKEPKKSKNCRPRTSTGRLLRSTTRTCQVDATKTDKNNTTTELPPSKKVRHKSDADNIHAAPISERLQFKKVLAENIASAAMNVDSVIAADQVPLPLCASSLSETSSVSSSSTSAISSHVEKCINKVIDTITGTDSKNGSSSFLNQLGVQSRSVHEKESDDDVVEIPALFGHVLCSSKLDGSENPMNFGNLDCVRSFCCDVCETCCNSWLKVKEHRDNVHGIDHPFKCQICLETLPQLSDLRNHEAWNHPSFSFRCQNCLKSFENEGLLNLHRQSHRISPQILYDNSSLSFACPECRQSFNSLVLLKLHISNQHVHVNSFKCQCCDFHAENPQMIIKHSKMTHPGKQPRFVMVKDSGYKIKTEVTKILETPRDLSSFYAGHPLYNSLFLSNVLRSSGSFYCDMFEIFCPHCNSYMTNFAQLKEHETKCHKTSSELPYNCGICDSALADLQQLESHLKTQHNPAEAKSGLECYVCPLAGCGFITDTLKFLNRHLHHEHPSEATPFQCARCVKKLETFEDRKKHFDSHYQYDFREFKKTNKVVDTKKWPGPKHRTKKLLCRLCHISFKSYTQFYIHKLKSHQDGDKLKCADTDTSEVDEDDTVSKSSNSNITFPKESSVDSLSTTSSLVKEVEQSFSNQFSGIPVKLTIDRVSQERTDTKEEAEPFWSPTAKRLRITCADLIQLSSDDEA